MNEEQLIEFINWLPTAVPEFKNANPDQIVQTLNKMYESEEGQNMLTQLFTAFQESKSNGQSQMFKKGGKMDAFVNKYGKKGCCKKAKDGAKIKNTSTKSVEKADNGKKLKERNDGTKGYFSEETNPFGDIVRVLSNKSLDPNNLVTWYTEQRITPQNDTTYKVWNNTSALPKIDAVRYVTPTEFNSRGLLSRIFGPKPAPENWKASFDYNSKNK